MRRIAAGFAILGLVGAARADAQSDHYRVAPPADGGSIEGIVRLSGTAPTIPPIKTTKNQDYCGLSIANPEYLVGTSGGLGNVEVFLRSIDHGKPMPTGNVTLMNRHCMFAPRVQGACVGQILRIGSDDPILHNTHPYFPATNATIFNLALPNKGTWVTRPLPGLSGLIPVRCDVHEWMRAWIWEFDHPYFATTDQDGHYRVTDVPPGSYVLVAWHEAGSAHEAAVTVTAGTETRVDFSLTVR